MKYAFVVLALAACGDETKPDSPAEAAQKLECQDLLVHLVKISPQMATTPQLVDAKAKALPIEELQQCTAAEPEIRACMAAAADVAGVKKCIPSDDVLGCMQKASKDPATRAKCWAGDAHAADGIKSE